MAEYYQIQNLDELKQIYPNVQLVNVVSDDVGVSTHNRPQQLLLQDESILLNEGQQQVVYQTTTSAAPSQYQQQQSAATTHYIIGDDIAQQQSHQPQVMLHQNQAIEHHQQQQAQQQQHFQHEPQQTQVQPMQQDHQMQHVQQQAQQQPSQQLYYTTEQILHSSPQSQLHVQQQQQYQQQQQQIVHPHALQSSPPQQQQQQPQQQVQVQQQPQQQIVYRMQQQQPSQQLHQQSHAHVIVQQPSGQQVLIQSPPHQDIVMRQSLPPSRIIYNTNRVLYTPQQQPNAQSLLQPHQQQQHIQLQARVAPQPQDGQHPQMQQNVVFHQVQSVQSPQLQVRGTIRTKLPRGGIAPSPSLIARMPAMSNVRGMRPNMVPGAQGTKAPRPRGGSAAGGNQRARGAPRGGRGGAVMAAGRGIATQQMAVSPAMGGNLQATGISQAQQIAQQSKNVTITSLHQQGQIKQVYRTQQIIDSNSVSQQQLQLIHNQQRPGQAAPRFRSPSMNTPPQGQLQSSPPATVSSSGNVELDLEESIQAVVVKKDQQKAVGAGIQHQMSTTLTTYYAKDEDENNRLIRTQNGTCITLAEYKKRNLGANIASGSAPLGSTMKGGILPMRAGVPLTSNVTSNASKITTQAPGGQPNTAVPIARVAPQKICHQNQADAPQTSASSSSSSSSSSVHQTSHNNYEIQTQHVLQNRSGQQMAEKDRNSAKMLVILVSGEQRLITFTLPRESCTVQDLLEQVGVPFDTSTTIQCVENPGANIDFVVTVGFSVQESASELISRAEQSLQMSRQQESSVTAASAAAAPASATQSTSVSSSSTGTNTPAPFTAAPAAVADDSANKDASAAAGGSNSNSAKEEVPRKIIQGFYAICQSCGYTGYDHAKCERCKRVFMEPPKRVPIKSSGAVSNSAMDALNLPKALGELTEKKRSSEGGRGKSNLAYGANNAGARGRGGSAARGRSNRSRRTAEAEPVILTLSSDEEEDEEASNKESTSGSIANCSKSTAPMAITYRPFLFEPQMPEKDEVPIYNDFKRGDVTDLSNSLDNLITTLKCKVIRIGTYRFESQEPVTFTSKGIRIVAPLVTNPNEFCALHIYKREVVKIIAHFSKTSESILCFYTLRMCAKYIKSSLQMKDSGDQMDGIAYFSPTGPYQVRKIILQFDSISDQARSIIRSIWDFFDEISVTDAQDLLQRATDVDRQLAAKSNDDGNNSTTQLNPNEIRQLLIYPPGKGGISINTEDYMCLATDQYLNDIIIDFYLKWVHNTVIPAEQREKTFIFSTFFYKRLTTLTRHQHQDKEVKPTAAQKRHARVQNWTKNVNLFEKDYIIIPINEQSHWFLAIICFPKLEGPVTFDTNTPVEPQQIKKQKGKKVSLQIGNTTITPLSKRDTPANVLAEVCGVGDEDSERDEAEGDESDLASEESDSDNANPPTNAPATTSSTTTTTTAAPSPANNTPVTDRPFAIKQPLILIFDSLAGASRSRVVATLRDYLTCEYRAKMPEATARLFNKDSMPGHCVKVPQQNNFTDCGLYLLQYVEQFFNDPIRDYRLPIKQLSNWFDTLTVTRKREDISLLLQKLMNEKNGPNQKVILPEIPFPTLNGILVEPPEGYNIEFEEEEMEEEAAEEEEDSGTAAGGDVDTESGADEANAKSVPKAAATTSLIPTHGRKIVVKRRMPIAGASSAEAVPQQSPGNGRAAMVKIRKLEL